MRLLTSAHPGALATAAVTGFAKSARRAVGHAVDLLLPPTALDEGERPQSPGLSVRAWERIEFLEAPVCDGCGSPFPL